VRLIAELNANGLRVPAGSEFSTIWTNTPGELWAIDPARNSTLWHFVAGQWDAVLTSTPDSPLTLVAGTGPADVWVAPGLPLNYGAPSGDATSGLFHYDGSGWVFLPLNLPEIDAIQPRPGGRCGSSARDGRCFCSPE
jgi:hypothetical protein